MNAIHIESMDLNLLVVFDALMRERNATRAARRLGLTQPAVSHALGRLRLLLDDPLFVRSPRGLTPTPEAETMAAEIAAMLDSARAVLGRERGFNPASSARSFRIGLSDYAAAVLLPGLIDRMAAEAPGTTLVVKNTRHDEGLTLLENGGVELIAGNFPPPPPHLRAEELFRETFICAVRSGHPAFGKKPTLKRYLELGHLQVSTRGDPHGYADNALRALNAERRVKVTVGHFLVAPHLLATTDLVATEPRRLFLLPAFRGMLALSAPPFAVPGFAVDAVWHSRYDSDPGHRWLRGLVHSAAARLVEKIGRG